MNFLMLVNKNNGLDKHYVPDDLVEVKTKLNKTMYLNKTVYKWMKKMLKKANKNFNTEIIIESAYRSYDYQEYLVLLDLKKKENIEEVNKTLALPGFSEHQTGLAVDIGFINEGVYEPDYDINKYHSEFQWLHENAYKYGFILRYEKGKEEITGYNYEPWHFRYVGKIHAKIMHDENKTLEEYLNCDILV